MRRQRNPLPKPAPQDPANIGTPRSPHNANARSSSDTIREFLNEHNVSEVTHPISNERERQFTDVDAVLGAPRDNMNGRRRFDGATRCRSNASGGHREATEQ
jgi:hypothetical protein